ncbi:hypothetical protein OIU77_015281 [Salix suchowensis]|uniref:J domain-containing protein n=1 Tax=Salix suchowensis TaxID=1278906 RepID=A0ABQ8ZSR5_9ROSI|nr:hypothetical protein OIU77_015281 [Salix suchowensis]
MVLGIRRDASSDIRSAYRKLAMNGILLKAYSVLSDQSKKSMYDAGLYDPLEEEDEEFCNFMQEMISMMNNVKDEGDSFEDLQKMFGEMVGGNGVSFDLNDDPTSTKRARVTPSKGNAAKRSTSCR